MALSSGAENLMSPMILLSNGCGRLLGEALGVYKKALNEGIEKYLVGRPVKPVLRQFN